MAIVTKNRWKNNKETTHNFSVSNVLIIKYTPCDAIGSNRKLKDEGTIKIYNKVKRKEILYNYKINAVEFNGTVTFCVCLEFKKHRHYAKIILTKYDFFNLPLEKVSKHYESRNFWIQKGNRPKEYNGISGREFIDKYELIKKVNLNGEKLPLPKSIVPLYALLVLNNTDMVICLTVEESVILNNFNKDFFLGRDPNTIMIINITQRDRNDLKGTISKGNYAYGFIQNNAYSIIKKKYFKDEYTVENVDTFHLKYPFLNEVITKTNEVGGTLEEPVLMGHIEVLLSKAPFNNKRISTNFIYPKYLLGYEKPFYKIYSNEKLKILNIISVLPNAPNIVIKCSNSNKVNIENSINNLGITINNLSFINNDKSNTIEINYE